MQLYVSSHQHLVAKWCTQDHGKNQLFTPKTRPFFSWYDCRPSTKQAIGICLVKPKPVFQTNIPEEVGLWRLRGNRLQPHWSTPHLPKKKQKSRGPRLPRASKGKSRVTWLEAVHQRSPDTGPGAWRLFRRAWRLSRIDSTESRAFPRGRFFSFPRGSEMYPIPRPEAFFELV